MPSYKISLLAESDILEIGYFTESTWGLEQSNYYLEKLYKCFEFIANNPKLGRTCSEIKEGYYAYPYGKHSIFYRIGSRGIEIIRILHQNMDIIKHMQ